MLALLLQDGSQPAEQRLADRQPGSTPASIYSPSSLHSTSNSLDVSDPTHVTSFNSNFRQPSLDSHLTKAASTAIMNGEYVDFASLLPLSSLLTITINSQLNLKVSDQGLTIPLPSSSKGPKNHHHREMARCLCHLFRSYGFRLSLTCCGPNSISAANSGRSREIPMNGMVCQRFRIQKVCFSQPFC